MNALKKIEKAGTLRKMNVQYGEVITYQLNLDKEAQVELNQWIGKDVMLEWDGQINCINCGKSIPKTYQGFCYTCFTEAPSAAPCIIRPELCEAHLGKGRDVEWEQDHHNQPHVVYVAQVSDLKVGVTRSTQVPTRWIDQGAWRTAVLAEVPYRQLAGAIEIELKQYLSDRTDWRKMLKGIKGDDDLAEALLELQEYLPKSLSQYTAKNNKVMEFNYPVAEYPKKLVSLAFEKEHLISAKLTGIRGQYLYFDGNKVINMRKYSGFHVIFKAEA